MTTFFIGFIFALYILLQKEKLARQGRQLCYAFLPETAADQVLDVLRLSEKTFSNFLSGQCLEAVILGTMFVLAMSILHFPYALLVGVLIALTALIPIVGAFIAIVIRNFNNAVSVFSVPVYYAFYCTLQRIQSKSLPHVPWPFYHIWRCEAKPF